MSKYDEAGLILKLYELRREAKLREARDWFFSNFNPQSVEDITSAWFGDHGVYLRMVFSYWDMAAAMVNHGAISQEFFSDTNGEHLGVFAKIEPFLDQCRAASYPDFLKNLEHLIDSSPHGRERTHAMRQRMKDMQAERAGRRPQREEKVESVVA